LAAVSHGGIPTSLAAVVAVTPVPDGTAVPASALAVRGDGAEAAAAVPITP
jgi:hypothetical protein